jgi:hypothetical protein
LGRTSDNALRRFHFPNPLFDQPLDELIPPGTQVHHPALVVAYQGTHFNAPDGESIDFIELSTAQVCTPQAQEIVEILRQVQPQLVVYAPADQERGLVIFIQ